MIGLSDDSINAMYLIKTHYIMRVIEFHPENQTVDLIQDVFEFCNAPMGEITVKNELGYDVNVNLMEPDVIYGVPVKQERWGQFEIQACPQPGDTGYIEVFTNDITSWVQNGQFTIPKSDRHFAKDSCVFVPFIPNEINKAETYPADGTQLIIKSTNATIKITDSAEEGQDPVVDIETTAKTVHINAEDGVSVAGNVDITGDLTVSGTITADGDITSSNGDVVASGISLKNHTHGFNYVGAGQGSTPQTGTTETPQ